MAWIYPDWPAPPGVNALMTTRHGGVSGGGYRGLNLASHVGDAPWAVAENRRRLQRAAHLPAEVPWLAQCHSTEVVELGEGTMSGTVRADAAVSRSVGLVCAVLTADCLPILVTSRRGGVVAAIHAGWRGLAEGVIEQSLQTIGDPADELLVWLGTAISQRHFEVGSEVREAFVVRDSLAERAFIAATLDGKWYADLYLLARQRLTALGVRAEAIYGGQGCTFAESERFFSYRRDGGQSGRMATLIWMGMAGGDGRRAATE
ncbi:peptidoglycan editing factor PgeF [Ectothiorhodospiraceae bacterium BW-2]|nr:peptidoglycan editing factor PgeF [Ectothiorhodospiraceae bacterium BW-2]